MKKGLPCSHQQFWNEGVAGLYKLYRALAATPSEVLQQHIKEPQVMELAEQRILDYLFQFIGQVKTDELQLFLRFCTASSVCIDKPLSITFNGLYGLERRPIAHTCSCLLELSRTYSTYAEFSGEFKAVFEAKAGWIMDCV
jgi:hypothetical protein